MFLPGIATPDPAALLSQPTWILGGAVVAAVATWAMIWLLQPLAARWGLLDHPQGGRKDHGHSTPVTGGLGIALVLLLLFVALPLPMTQGKLGYLVGAGLLLVVGLLDDLHDLRWWWRILAQVAAALVMVYLGGVRIEQLGPAFGLDDMTLGVLSVPFTVFATVGLINAVNMIDGADGVAGSLVAAALLMLGAAAWYAGNAGVTAVSLVICGATVGFLAHNFRLPWRPRARVFLGNAGSAFLGYSVAWIVFRLTQNAGHPVNPVLALWLLPVPVIDCLVLIVRRIRQRRSPFSADRDHVHHLMRDAGFSTAQLCVVLAGFSLLSGLAVGQAMRIDVPNPLLLALFVLACAIWLWLTLHREQACRMFAGLHRLLFGRRRTAEAAAAVAPDAETELVAVAGRESTVPAPSSVAGHRRDQAPDRRYG